jgi:predicted RNase H-like HicB family nuclease
VKRYRITVEETDTGYSAYSPDLDGCVATGKTREEVEREMRGAIAFHLEGMARGGRPSPVRLNRRGLQITQLLNYPITQ